MMASTAEGEVVAKAHASVEDRVGLRSRTSTGEDGGGNKDRERPRQQVAQTRPTLSAVGRVASRVKTSGISKISTLLPKGRDDEEVNASPWGVGKAAMERSQSTSMIASGVPTSGGMRQAVSPGAQNSADVLEMSSPMSTDDAQSPPAEQPKAIGAANDQRPVSDPPKFQKALSVAVPPMGTKTVGDRARAVEADRARTPEFPLHEGPTRQGEVRNKPEADRARTPESPIHGQAIRHGEARTKPTEPGKILERLGSKNVRSKFHFRPSLQVESESPINREANSDSPFAPEEQKPSLSDLRPSVKFQKPDGDARTDGGENEDLTKESLTKESLPGTESTDKDTSDTSTSRVTFLSSPAADQELERMQSFQDVEKSRVFGFNGFGRSKSRPEARKRKSKADKPRGKLGLPRSKSNAGRKVVEHEPVIEDDSKMAVPCKNISQRSQDQSDNSLSKRRSSVARVKKVGWLNLKKGENGSDRSEKQGGGMRGRTKSRKEEAAKDEQKLIMPPDFFAKQPLRRRDETTIPPKTILFGRKRGKSSAVAMNMSKKSSFGIDVVNVDEYIVNSDDEEKESGAPVRSLAVDDFISYQTKQGKKGKAKS